MELARVWCQCLTYFCHNNIRIWQLRISDSKAKYNFSGVFSQVFEWVWIVCKLYVWYLHSHKCNICGCLKIKEEMRQMQVEPIKNVRSFDRTFLIGPKCTKPNIRPNHSVQIGNSYDEIRNRLLLQSESLVFLYFNLPQFW